MMTQHSVYLVIMFLTLGGYGASLLLAIKAGSYALDMFDDRKYRLFWNRRKTVRLSVSAFLAVVIFLNIGSVASWVGQRIMPARPETRTEALRVCQDAMYSRFIACVEGYGFSVNSPDRDAP